MPLKPTRDTPFSAEAFQRDGRWFLEKECPLCLRITVHDGAAQRGPFTCLRCERITSEAFFDAQVVASLVRLGIMNQDGSLSGGMDRGDGPPF